MICEPLTRRRNTLSLDGVLRRARTSLKPEDTIVLAKMMKQKTQVVDVLHTDVDALYGWTQEGTRHRGGEPRV